jgi:hypothetical protein
MEFEDMWSDANHGMDTFLLFVEPVENRYNVLRRTHRRDMDRGRAITMATIKLLFRPFSVLQTVLSCCRLQTPADDATYAYRAAQAIQCITRLKSLSVVLKRMFRGCVDVSYAPWMYRRAIHLSEEFGDLLLAQTMFLHPDTWMFDPNFRCY